MKLKQWFFNSSDFSVRWHLGDIVYIAMVKKKLSVFVLSDQGFQWNVTKKKNKRNNTK